MISTDAQKDIERSFYESIRLGLVAAGWTPDITSFAHNTTGQAAYTAALKAIKVAKGFAIELFGTAAPAHRGNLEVPRIVLDGGEFVPGDYGIDPSPQLISDGAGGFYAADNDNLVYRYFISVRIIANTQEEIRQLIRSVHTGIPLRGYLKHHTLDDTFLVFLITMVDDTLVQDSLQRKVFSFEVPDVSFYIESDVEPGQDIIVPMTEYELIMNTNHDIIQRLGI